MRDWLARVDDRFMGTPIDVDPYEAILHAIRVCAGEVAYCDAQVRRLSDAELFERPAETTMAQLPSGKWIVVEETRNAEVISRWVTLRDAAMDQMVIYSEKAVKLGIDERRVRVAERVADVLAPLLSNLADDLRLTPEQRHLLPAVIDRNLRLLEEAPAA